MNKQYMISSFRSFCPFLPPSYHADLTAKSACQLDKIRSMLGYVYEKSENVVVLLYAASCSTVEVRSELIGFYSELSATDKEFLSDEGLRLDEEQFLLS